MGGNIAELYGGEGFDTGGEGMENRDPLPAGWYHAYVDEAEVNPTKEGTGYCLKLRFCIIDEEYKNRKVFKYINLRNQSAEAEAIGQRELTSFGRAIGLTVLEDSSNCLDKPLRIRVKLKNDKVYGPGNDIGAYEPIEGSEGAPARDEATQSVAAEPDDGQPPAENAPAPAPAAPAAQTQAKRVSTPAANRPAPAGKPGGKMPWKK